MSESLKLFFLVADKALHLLLENLLLCMLLLTHFTLCIQLWEKWKRGEEGGEEEGGEEGVVGACNTYQK